MSEGTQKRSFLHKVLSSGEEGMRPGWMIGIFAVLHAVVTLYFIKLGMDAALRILPMPSSDYLYYWNLASDYSLYHKGGIIGFIYAPFKQAGLVPYHAALIVNSFFYMAASASLWLGTHRLKTPYYVLGQVLLTFASAVFGLWNSGYAGMVNADFPNVALILIAVRFFFEYAAHADGPIFEMRHGRVYLALGTLSLYLAVALRVKTGLALGIIVGLLIVFYFKQLKRVYQLRVIVFAVIVAVGFAAGTELALRYQSDAKTDIARQGRLQLYTGLLDTQTGSMAGRWTKSSYDKTLAELDKPFLEVLKEHLSVKSKRYLLQIIKDKWTAVLNYDEFSYRELIAFGVTYRTPTADDYALARAFEPIEERTVNDFKYAVYLMLLLPILFRKKYVAWLPFFIWGAFMLLHAVFEIQARYMVEPLMWSYVTSVGIMLGVPRKEKRHV